MTSVLQILHGIVKQNDRILDILRGMAPTIENMVDDEAETLRELTRVLRAVNLGPDAPAPQHENDPQAGPPGGGPG